MIKWLKCLFHRHNLYVVQDFNYYSRRVACSKCGKSWGMNDQVQAFIPWTGDLEDLYKNYLGHEIIIKPWRSE